MTDLPAPLVAPDVDLSGFGKFMFDANRFLASELVAIGTLEERGAALMLWSRAWQQKPAASLPDDPKILQAFSDAGARWPKVREMAMRGFVKCSDGRLYHRVLAEEANAAWERRKSFKDKSEKGVEARKRLAEQKRLAGKPQMLLGAPPGINPTVVPGEKPEGDEETRQDKKTSSSTGEPAMMPDANDLHRRLLAAAEDHVTNTIGIEVVKPILDLIAQGCDVERHILPAVRETVPRLGKPLGTWAAPFLRDEILARRDRDRGAPKSASGEERVDFGGGYSAPISTIRKHAKRGEWLPDWGPRPGEPGCRVPEHLLNGVIA